MSDPAGSRRSFLNPKNLAKVVTTATGGEWPNLLSSPSLLGEGAGGRGSVGAGGRGSVGAGGRGSEGAGGRGSGEGLLYRLGRPAMAAQFEVLFEVEQTDWMPAAESALGMIDELEAQLSVYRDSSELCAINRKAYDQAVEVEAGLFGLLLECKQIWEETGGAYDITIQALLETWGVFRPPRRTPSQAEIETALTRCGIDGVELTPLKPVPSEPLPPTPSPKREGEEREGEEDSAWENVGRKGVKEAWKNSPKGGSIRFLRPGLGLNLASVGKGYALEKVAKHLQAQKMEHFLLYGGGSSLLARGSSTWEDGWLAGITTPLDWSKPIVHIRLENQALSTSAVDADTIKGTLPPHILDPRTGQTVSTDLVSATVMTGSASRAEGLSTAFLVMGLDKVLEYCEKHPDVGAVLLRWSRESSNIELIHTGITKHQLEVLS